VKSAYARLHVLLARNARVGLVIRHGTATSVCTLLWDRNEDKFVLGQWMRWRIETETCDLSPDGEHFLYTARKYVNAMSQSDQWTVVSRAPYLKAVAYYPGRGAGGWFVNDREYCVRSPGSGPDDRESPEVRRVESDSPQPSLYAARLARAGWIVKDLRAQFLRRVELVRPAGSGWELRHYPQGGYLLSRGELVADTRCWDWADMDDKRLVWAAKGCLWAGASAKDGIQQIRRLLHDFNRMRFERLAALYESGRPVQPRPSPPMGAMARRAPRSPVRKKPNRSKVRREDEADH
jgi:hypothetical protein